MLRRLLVFSLVAIFAFALLSACADRDDDSTPAGADDTVTTEVSDDAIDPTPEGEAATGDDAATDDQAAGDDAASDDGMDDADISGDLMIFTAGSLTAAFEEMKDELETEYTDLSITLNIGNSAALRTQLEEGARADVFASANIAQMELAQEAERIDGQVHMFAGNQLIMIVPSDNPAGIESVADLAESGTMVVLAQEQVPVGAYARQSLALMSQDPDLGEDFKDRVMDNVVSEEQTVMAVVTKIQLGEADAGIVFQSELDASLEEDVLVIEIPDEFNVIAEYPIARVEAAPNLDAADMFIEFVLGSEGQAILERHGFLQYGE